MYTENLIKNIAEKTGIDISKFDINELVMGMDVELEHGSNNEMTDVTDDDPIKTFKIVMAHMYEMPDYYTKLKAMENKENISEYARRMRELAGLSEGNQNKSLKTIQEGKSSFEDGVTFMVKDFMKSNDNSKSRQEEIVKEHVNDIDPQILDSLRLKFPDASDEELDNIYSAMQMKESKENKKDDFETHKFEQKAIEEGANDEELYTLNENTIIVLDFLDDEDEK